MLHGSGNLVLCSPQVAGTIFILQLQACALSGLNMDHL